MKISESVCHCCCSLFVLIIFQSQSHSTAAFSFGTNFAKQSATTATATTFPRQAVAVNSIDELSVISKEDDDDNNNNGASATAFELLAGLASVCLLESDIRRDAIGQPEGTQASSATNWINDASAFALQKAMDSVELKLPERRVGVDRDEASTWIRWMKSTPTTLIVDISGDLRKEVNKTLNPKTLELIGTTRDDFLARMGCRLILMPSGSTLERPLEEPPASVVYGKVLYGGVTRYRLLPSSNSNRPKRRAGERTEVKTSIQDATPVWLMYGGPERAYDCVDMGAAAVLELILLPKGKTLPNIVEQPQGGMTVSRIGWSPHNIFECIDKRNGVGVVVNGDSAATDMKLMGSVPAALSGKDRNEAFQSDFRSAVGGLQPQIEAIVRRVLDGRVIRPAEVVDQEITNDDETTRALAVAAMEAEELSLLGLSPVRGLLLYGPPGCGKTALARELSRALRARQPKIVSAPELLDRWVGGSEKLVRALFAEAEAELAVCNGDASRSALHVVVIDEIDAVFRKRSSGEDSGEATRASAVNQILSKLDGINAIPNVLMIGMTNRRELLDEALLRPGRLEVQIEIPLPDKEGRREIMQIHFDALRKKGRLSKPLCCAIDGVSVNSVSDFGASKGESSSGKRGVRQRLGNLFAKSSKFINPAYDLAVVTTGYSGADIAGMVRCAGSMALSRARKDGSGVEGLLITLEDVKQSLKEVKR